MSGVPSIRFNFTLAAAKRPHSGRVGADPSQITKKTAGKTGITLCVPENGSAACCALAIGA